MGKGETVKDGSRSMDGGYNQYQIIKAYTILPCNDIRILTYEEVLQILLNINTIPLLTRVVFSCMKY